MAKIVAGMLMSHTTFMVEWYDRANPEQAKRVTAGLDGARAALRAARPDVLVISGSDHVRTFFYDKLPAFCVGTGESCESWGEGGMPPYKATVHQGLARHILRAGLNRGWDLASSEEMKLDHAFFTPMHELMPGMDLPIVPLFQNCNIPPMPTMQRCLEVGRYLREAIESWPGEERVAILGSGGISHWVGVPRMGEINADFDRKFLAQIEQGDLNAIAAYTEEELDAVAGNGAQELRAWATVLGALRDWRWQVTCYEPVLEWATGIGLVVSQP